MGAGPIGLSTLLWCKARGAEAVVVSELAPARVELAHKLGATAVVESRSRRAPPARLRNSPGASPTSCSNVSA